MTVLEFYDVTYEIPHCSNPKKVLNENDTPQFLQFPFVYTLERQNWSL